MEHKTFFMMAIAAVLTAFSAGQSFAAEDLEAVEFARGGGGEGGKGGGKTDTTKPPSYFLQSWMHEDVGAAWQQGYLGSGSQILFVDDFTSGKTFLGDLGAGGQYNTHGEWTSLMGSMIAPEASIATQDFSSSRGISLNRRKLNVVNLSYGMMAADGYASVNWSPREESIVSAARSGSAVVVKAAGNDYGTAVGQANSKGVKDYLNVDLIGTETVIFTGALSSNGSVDAQASMASYSNIAGDNIDVQDHFLVVGVEGSDTGLYGTSFAAPIVSGYSAIIGSKFGKATPVEITNRLLDTARADTVLNYDVSVHGQGEASLSRALAPNAIQ